LLPKGADQGMCTMKLSAPRGTVAATLLAAIVIVSLAVPARAVFPGAKRCYAQPTLRQSTATLIAKLTASISDYRPTEDKACELFARGLLYHFEGNTERAMADYSSAIGWMPQFPASYEMRGDAYADLGQPDKAAADYAKAASIPEDATGLANRCWMRALRGRPLDRALADCNESLRQRPDDADTLDSLCLVHFRMADYPAAIADCESALKLSPKGAASLYVRGLAKIRSGDKAGGEADLAAARGIFPKAGEYYALWGIKP
jgi:tetratricopeptide (TPR) repeat protein